MLKKLYVLKCVERECIKGGNICFKFSKSSVSILTSLLLAESWQIQI